MIRQCSVWGCPNPARYKGLCREHAARQDALRRHKRTFPYNRAAWLRLRQEILRNEPRCAECGAPASEVHHVVPRASGGEDALHNLVALCKPCHSRITGHAVAKMRGE